MGMLGGLTICCKEVERTATQAQIKPLRLTLTSVTVQTPTPITTTTTAILTSLEYCLLWRIHSMTQTTGIMLNFEIWLLPTKDKDKRWNFKNCCWWRGRFVRIRTYLIEADWVEHEAEVHPCDRHIGNDGEPEKLPKRDMLGSRITRRIRHQTHKRSYSEVKPS